MQSVLVPANAPDDKEGVWVVRALDELISQLATYVFSIKTGKIFAIGVPNATGGGTAITVTPDGRITFGYGDNNQIAMEILPDGYIKFSQYNFPNAVVFQINPDGTLHGKTGASIHFDL